MSALWLIRHGQAGTRTNYDTLSDAGREQARRLGEWLAAQKVRFTSAIAGELNRQRETAAAVRTACEEAGLSFPALTINPGWNEFDLDGVYRDIAPVLAAAGPEFRAEYEQMLRDAADEEHGVHRRWTGCDLQVLRAWVEGRLPTSCETWAQFQLRIEEALGLLAKNTGDGEEVAVFTSATPIGIACGIALGAGVRARVEMAGAQYNSAFSVLRVRAGAPRLFSFNNIPHLGAAAARTFR